MSSLGGTYSTGTVALTNDNAVVLGTGVLWSDVEEGDWLYAGGFVGIIDSVNDDFDEITLKEPWTGSTDAAASYLIIKMSWLRYEPASPSEAACRAGGAGGPDRHLLRGGSSARSRPRGRRPVRAEVEFGAWKLWFKTGGTWGLQGTPVGTNGEGRGTRPRITWSDSVSNDRVKRRPMSASPQHQQASGIESERLGLLASRAPTAITAASHLATPSTRARRPTPIPATAGCVWTSDPEPATVIRADLLDAAGVTVTSLLDQFSASTSNVKAQLRLTKEFDPASSSISI